MAEEDTLALADGSAPTSNARGQREIVPPENFSLVSPGIYRSGFPKSRNFTFLKQLKIKSVLTLVPESMPDNVNDFYKENGITLYQFGVPGNKEPFHDIPIDKIAEALGVLLNANAHGILVHCNKGKHRTGCLIGCLRKIQHWSHIAICEEYRRFAHPKARALDQQFIELFDVSQVKYDRRYPPRWL